ncbi:MAG: EF-hand domain-containing protein [Bacteroidota bacterium]
MNKKWLMVLMLGGIFTTGAVAQEKVSEKKPAGEKMIAKVDTDSDGKISKDEADKAPKGKLKENFAAIDTNKDNYLDKEEIKAYRKEKKAEMQPSTKQ